MVNACCAYGCNNKTSKTECREKRISFHQFPLNDERRLKLWLLNIRRKSFIPNRYTKICSEHFDEEDFKYQPFTNLRLLKDTAVPKKFCFTSKSNNQSRPRTSYKSGSGIIKTENCDPAQESPMEGSSGINEIENCDPEQESPNELDERSSIIEPEDSDPEQESPNDLDGRSGVSETEYCTEALQASNEIATQTEGNFFHLLLQELEYVKEENATLKSKLQETEISPKNLDDNELKSLTGFSRNQFNIIHLFLSSIEKQKLFLFLMRLKSGMTERMMGLFFRKSQSTISRSLAAVTEEIYRKVSSVKIWPDRTMVLDKMPHLFRLHLQRCRVIIDCMEFEIQKPSNPKEQQFAFSNHKNMHTVKCLIGISPSGGISFISEAWGGSVSDKELFLKSGILDLLEPGDIILADNSFSIKAEVEAKGCELITPSFFKDKIQINISEKKGSKKISRDCVYVERPISRVKQFKFFNSQISYNSLHSICELIYIAAFFTKFGNSLIKS